MKVGSPRCSVTDAAGNVTTCVYDGLNRLTSTLRKNSDGATLASYGYGYDNYVSDNKGNMTQVTRNGALGLPEPSMSSSVHTRMTLRRGAGRGIAFGTTAHQVGAVDGGARPVNGLERIHDCDNNYADIVVGNYGVSYLRIASAHQGIARFSVQLQADKGVVWVAAYNVTWCNDTTAEEALEPRVALWSQKSKPVFETLTSQLQRIFETLGRSHRTLAEADIQEVMKDVRRAMLEADVNFTVVKDFIAKIMERARNTDVLQATRPDQQLITVVREQLIELLGVQAHLDLDGASSAVVMLVGLQGSGKTLTSVKLASSLQRMGIVPLLVTVDIYRPSASDQLERLGRQLAIPVYTEPQIVKPIIVCQNALRHARTHGQRIVILDTVGRLHIDDEMMDSITTLSMVLPVREVLLVADAMTGQEAVHVAGEFNKRGIISGLILTRLDGDTKGGGLLSIRAVTGIPIKFLSVGEEINAFEPFDPGKLANRILGLLDRPHLSQDG